MTHSGSLRRLWVLFFCLYPEETHKSLGFLCLFIICS